MFKIVGRNDEIEELAVSLGDLDSGDIFFRAGEGELLMKSDEADDEEIIVVALKGGVLYREDPDILVDRADAVMRVDTIREIY